MRISREGYLTIGLVTGVVAAVGLALVWIEARPAVMAAVLVPLTLVWLLVVSFFRDPDRVASGTETDMVSPADGRVILVEPVREDIFVQDEVVQVSIFLSVFNVHVNRIPYSGIVRLVQYHEGEFLAAFDRRASIRNEQSLIGIESNGVRILFKQIAGLLARRLVYCVRENDKVSRGERFGIMKFGSRIDLLIPKSFDIRVKVGDIVRGGSTIIASLRQSTL